MKINKNKVLILCISVVLGLCGCRNEDEVVFVDIEAETEYTPYDLEDDIVTAGADSKPGAEPAQIAELENSSEELQEPEPRVVLVVHVCGAVVAPGVYELDLDSRVIDAVDRAGGLLETASLDYVNLAGLVSDGDKITIPTKEEAALMKQNSSTISIISSSSGQNLSGRDVQTELSGKININTADQALLCTLPGIGVTRASSIIAYREEHGHFAAIEDIMQVSGIKDSSFQKIKDFIVVN